MFEIKALRQKKTDLLAKPTAIATLAKAEKRDLTEAERTECDTALASLKVVNADIARVEALMDEERVAAGAGARADISESGKLGFKSLGEQLTAVHQLGARGIRDERLFAAAQGANEAVDSEGGILIQPEFTETILKRTYEVGILTSRITEIPMSSNRLRLNAVDEDSRADGQRWGGIQVYWEVEAQNYTATKPKFRPMEMNANKLIGMMFTTEELLADAPALQSYTNQAFPDEFSFKIDDAIMNGPGAGMPLGIQTSGAVLQVAKDAGQAAKTITTTNILNMWSRMWAPSRRTAFWAVNQDVEPQLYPLTLGTGTAVTLLYTPPGMFGNNSPYGLLMGRPVIPIEQAATLGTVGDITLIDPTQYLLGKKGGLRSDSSIHVAFLTGEQAFRFMLRLDGQPTWKKPLTPKNGTNTLAPFVSLQAR